ncbi:PAS domain S-box-containing protein [Desulfonatronum thiosulfatophilum]|uniref:histidine kinase n=1 Tax=Desulfonatronum thiosulfatophilum TaxID=617002 RepID=A0A1G6EQN8_9BACT|nr:ATP-binding protein [Desulfonatronum thiosulfatophilum]SDB59666.1 PAS domain S-box-containing protein [Desulfonatronum thiosulfatophilum]
MFNFLRKHNLRLSIRIRMLALCVLAVIVPMALVAGSSLYFHIRHDQQAMLDNLRLSQHRAEHFFVQHIRQAEILGQHLARTTQPLPFAQIQSHLDSSRDFWFMGMVEIFDELGNLLARSYAPQRNIELYFTSPEDARIAQILDLSIFSDFVLTPGGIAVQSGVPIIDPGTMKTTGVVLVTYPITTRFLQALKNHLLMDVSVINPSDETMSSTLQNPDGKLLDRFWRPFFVDGAAPLPTETFLEETIDSADHAVIFSDLQDNQGKTLAVLAVSANLDRINAGIRESIRFILFSSLGAGILAVFLGLFTATTFTKPLGRLLKTIGLIAGGDLRQQVHIARSDEIGDLARAFNEMTVRLNEQHVDLTRAIDVKNEYAAKLEETASQLERFSKELEQTVARRTTELTSANEKLVLEISERVQAEAELAAEKDHLAVTLRSIGDGVITTDIRGNVIMVNPVAEDITGWSPEAARGKPLGDMLPLVDPDTRAPLANLVVEVLRTGHVVHLTERTALLASDGRLRDMTVSGAPIRDSTGKFRGVVFVVRDITRQRRMENDLLRVQKLESLGLMAGGLAHDFNNILTAIATHINLARNHLQPVDSEAAQRLEKAEKACLRAGDLTRQFLTFAKGGAPIKRNTDLSVLLHSTVQFVLAGTQVQAKFDPPPNLWAVNIDRGQISQVINNLVLNAVQAMPGGGSIDILAANVEIAAGQVQPLPQGRYVSLTFTDHGTGIRGDQISRVFDPYFTTKEMGNGLGLSTAFSIIKKHDGHIQVRSDYGQGAEFQIYLPAESSTVVIERTSPKEKPFGRNQGRILLMDDERIIRESVQELLELQGFTVTGAANGQEAVNLYEQAMRDACPYDVVILDLTVPGGMGGREAIAVLLEMDPRVKAVVSSGYSNDPVMARYRDHGFLDVVAKPYPLNELITVIHKVMNMPESSRPVEN